MKRWQRLGSLTLAAAMLLGAPAGALGTDGFSRIQTYAQEQFRDVRADAWYAASVKDCYELGLMNGSGAHTFSPDGMFTVAEGLTIAARLNDLYGGGSGQIPQADGPWYQGAVNFCTEKGIIRAGQFADYEKYATRAEMAGIFAAALPAEALPAKNDIRKLPDVTAATDSAEAIFLLYNAGVVGGSDEYGSFQPNAGITRAEVAAIVTRLALPEQRKTLNLTPVSAVTSPQVTPSLARGVLSNDRIRYSELGKVYGYLNGRGEVVIPIQYRSAYDFEDGVAIVNDKQLIDTAGNVIFDSEQAIQRLSCGLFTRTVGKKEGVVDRTGKTIIPFEYSNISEGMDKGNPDKNYYISAYSPETKTYQYFSRSGEKMANIAKKALYSSFLDVIENGKHALYCVETGRITDAIYDQIKTDDEMARVRIGSKWGLVGKNGVIIPPKYGELDIKIVNNLAYVPVEGTYEKELISLSGYTGIRAYDVHIGEAITLLKTSIGTDEKTALFLDRDLNRLSKQNSLYEYTFFARKSCYAGTKEELSDQTYYAFESINGGYTAYNLETGECAGSGFATMEEAIKYCSSGRAAGNYYQIDTNEMGKPVVYYVEHNKDMSVGAETKKLVISEYKNGLYYDEITYVGEGHFVCVFGEEAYLIQA